MLYIAVKLNCLQCPCLWFTKSVQKPLASYNAMKLVPLSYFVGGHEKCKWSMGSAWQQANQKALTNSTVWDCSKIATAKCRKRSWACMCNLQGMQSETIHVALQIKSNKWRWKNGKIFTAEATMAVNAQRLAQLQLNIWLHLGIFMRIKVQPA